MHTLRRFWQSLEQVHGLSAAAVEWRQWLGSEWDLARSLLKSNGRRVSTLFCPSPGGDGCPRRVVVRDDGSIVAVCNDRPRRCDALVLQAEDVAALDVNLRKLAGCLATAFALDPEFTMVRDQFQLWRVGRHEVAAGDGFPVFLTIQATSTARRRNEPHLGDLRRGGVCRSWSI